MMKNIVMALFLILPMTVLAEPAPFGLEIGKATINDVKAKYKTTHAGTNKYSMGDMYTLEVSQLNFDGLQEATLVFSKENVLLAVLATLPNHKFDSLMEGMSAKYKLVSKDIPFVGNKSAKFVNGKTEITLDAPHLSFEMNMNYISKELDKAYKEQSSKERQQKQKRESSQL